MGNKSRVAWNAIIYLKEKKMHKTVVLTLMMLFAVIGMGCAGGNKPSDKDVEKALTRAYDVRFTLANKPYNYKYDYEVVSFERDNGQDLGNNKYEVTGKVILKPRSPQSLINDDEHADMSNKYEKKVAITFVKTEKGWKPIRLSDDILGVFDPMVDAIMAEKQRK